MKLKLHEVIFQAYIVNRKRRYYLTSSIQCCNHLALVPGRQFIAIQRHQDRLPQAHSCQDCQLRAEEACGTSPNSSPSTAVTACRALTLSQDYLTN